MTDTQNTEIERPLGPPAIVKLSGYEFYKSLGSPQAVVAPMVDASELAWRILSRLHGADLVYTPMINAHIFTPDNKTYLHEQFDLVAKEEGDAKIDRPLIAQFCSNDKAQFLSAAMHLAEKGVCDAVDLNLGCPQGIAKRGKYGAFLMEDWALIESLIHHLHVNLPVPVTAKFRVFDDVERTVAYAKMLEKAGAQIITVHGRTRDQKGQLTGRADWAKIKAVREAVTSIPVFANGNILIDRDVTSCIERTGCDGVMSAEGNLYNPALFGPLKPEKGAQYLAQLPDELREAILAVPAPADWSSRSDAYPSAIWMAKRYLAIVETIKTRTALSAVKSHLFKLFKPIFERGQMIEIRNKLGAAGSGSWHERIDTFQAIVEQLEQQLLSEKADDLKQQHARFDLPSSSDTLLPTIFPYDVCQPGLRPPAEVGSLDPAEAVNGGNKRARSGSPEVAAKKPKIEVKACITKDCPNSGAARCPKGACKVCCPALGEPCEAHQGKMKKLEDKRAAKKKHKEDRKQAKVVPADL